MHCPRVFHNGQQHSASAWLRENMQDDMQVHGGFKGVFGTKQQYNFSVAGAADAAPCPLRPLAAIVDIPTPCQSPRKLHLSVSESQGFLHSLGSLLGIAG